MLGNKDAPGLLPYSVKDLFYEINRREDLEFSVWISYIEIYKEQVNDLLTPGS